MKKFLFDGLAIQQAPNVKFHGGSEYAKFILKELIIRGHSFDIVFDENLSIPDDIYNLLIENNVKTILINNKKELYTIISNNNYRKFYSALPYRYTDYKPNTPFLGVIHGIRNIEIPWERNKHKFIPSYLKRLLGYLISKNKSLWSIIRRRNVEELKRLLYNPNFSFITVSYHSKYSILNYFPELDPDNIKVFYSPINIHKPDNSDLKKLDKDYFLIISGNRFEKNALLCVKAFDDLVEKGLIKDKQLYVVGVEDSKPFGTIKNSDKIKFFPYVPRKELDNLYQNSFCFIYPSLNEGFGYPPLIAMSYGIPVIASSATSIPEVCGNAALYFSPTNNDDFKSRLLRMCHDETLRAELIPAGIHRLEYIMDKQHTDLDQYIDLIVR